MSQINVNTIRNRTGGPPNLDKGAVVTGILTCTGDVSVGGTLTYEDVTNIDSVGLVTAKSGIKVGNPVSPGIGATIDPNGNAIFAGIVTAGIMSATTLYGDGSNLIGIDATAIQTGNTSVQTVDTGSDGHVKMTTEGGERVRVGPAGQIGLGGANYGTSGQVLTSAGSGSAPSWSVVPPGGNVITAEAEGAIAADKCVQIRTDGKVEQIKLSTTTKTSPSTNGNGGYLTNDTVDRVDNRMVYNPDNNTYLATFIRTNGHLDFMIGTPQSDNSIAWGYQATVTSSSSITDTSLVYAGNSRYLLTYDDGNNGNTVVKIGKVNSATSITWSAAVGMDGHNVSRYICIKALKIADDRVAFCCRANNGNCKWTDGRWGIVVGDITSDTAFTYRNSSQISEDPMQGEDFSAAFDSTNNIIFTTWKRSSYHGYCSSIQVASGNAATITTDGVAGDVVFEADSAYHNPDTIYHPGQDKFITTWTRGGNDDLWTKITTINSSTLAISNSSTIDLTGTNTSHDYEHTVCLTLGPGNAVTLYWIEQNKWLYAVTDPNFNGTTLSWSSKVNVAPGYNDYVESCVVFYNPDDTLKRNIFFGETFGNKPTWFTFLTESVDTNLVDGNHYLGFADQAYTDGQTATIKTYGNNTSDLSGLTPGTKYYVQNNGTVGTGAASPSALAGLAISATKLLIMEPKSDV